MGDRLCIYGASGYTGRLIVNEALARGLRPVLAGRTRAKLEAIAGPDGLTFEVVPLDKRAALDGLLGRVDVLLNAAGPFCATALPLARACLAHGVHYLDVGGEFAVFEALAALDAQAHESRVMLLPGVGFDVVLSDCAALRAASRLGEPTQLAIGLSGLDTISRGSAETVFDQFAQPVTIRREGQLVQVAPGELTRDFDFGAGPRTSAALSWADVSSAYRSTGISNITVYYERTPIVALGIDLQRSAGPLLRTPLARVVQGALIRLLPEGPSSETRARGASTIVVEVADAAGHSAEIRVHAPEVYSFTAIAAIACADRVLGGELKPGLQTPALAFGAEFGLSLPGVRFTERQGMTRSKPSRKVGK